MWQVVYVNITTGSSAHRQEEIKKNLTILVVLGFSCGRVHIGDTCSGKTLLKLIEGDRTLALAVGMACLAVDRRGGSLGNDGVVKLAATTRSEVRRMVVVLMVGCDGQATDSASVVGSWAVKSTFEHQ